LLSAHCRWHLSHSRGAPDDRFVATLSVADLKKYDGYRGRQVPSGRQIAQAKGLLGIAPPAKKTKKRKGGVAARRGRGASKASGVAQAMGEFKSALSSIVADADSRCAASRN